MWGQDLNGIKFFQNLLLIKYNIMRNVTKNSIRPFGIHGYLHHTSR